MGTNYYLHRKSACPTCGHQEEPLHIGKSSAGWCFALHVYPELGINDLMDWGWTKDTDDATLYEIRNEYGDKITPIKMLREIVLRSRDNVRFVPDYWYKSEPEMLRLNHAEWGPNNLLRSKIDGEHCIGHGQGTWDIWNCEFS